MASPRGEAAQEGEGEGRHRSGDEQGQRFSSRVPEMRGQESEQERGHARPLHVATEPSATAQSATAQASNEEAAALQPATRYLVDNEALPEAQYPSTALKHEDEYGAEALRPVWLQDVGHLAKIIADSRETIGVSNFAEVSTPRNSARTPAFPTFTRFSTTAFARSELGEARIIPGNRPGTGALFDLSYPVMLNVTDGRKVPLPGSSPQGIVDSQGYPLLYGADRPKKLIAARSSGALYPANLSRTLRNRMSTYPDATTVRTWAHMFQLSNEKDAQSILLQRVLGSAAGDNHIALLVKAYLAYFDNIVGALEGAVPARNRLSPEAVVINTNIVSGWTTRVLDSSAEIVNVLGGAPDYQEFWAYCSFDQPPIFAAKTSNETMTTSVFSHYRMHSGMSMVCICDREAYSAQRQPTFFGKPNLILGFIETYVQKFGLQQQANEALQIAMLWPTLVQANAHVSLPMALHAADWFGGEVERPSTETAYRGLISSSPYVALASTLAGAWALRSQIYDYVTLLAARRASWTLSSDTVQSCAAWLVRNASAPGVGWDFLLRHQFQVTPSLLYLTGLSVEVVDWSMLLSTFSWQEDEFPAHLRLIQPHWVKTSVCCTLPWERIWVPRFDTAGFLLSASPATIMCMLRLGLLRDTNRDRDQEEHNLGIFPILERPGTETIRYPDSIADQLRVVLDHGIRVLALSATPRGRDPFGAVALRDPTDSRLTREIWSTAMLSQRSES